MKQPVALTPQSLKTPHAAAVAGIIFAVLFTISMVLMRLTLPEDLSETNIAAGLQGNTATISLALTLAPFAGIAIEADTLMKSGVLSLGSAFIYTIMKVYSIRMAAVFMISSGSIWMRTHVMPRLFVFFTFAMAVLLLVISNLTFWLILIFPVWVLVISVFILIATLRGEHAEAAGMVGSTDLSKDK